MIVSEPAVLILLLHLYPCQNHGAVHKCGHAPSIQQVMSTIMIPPSLVIVTIDQVLLLQPIILIVMNPSQPSGLPSLTACHVRSVTHRSLMESNLKALKGKQLYFLFCTTL